MEAKNNPTRFTSLAASESQSANGYRCQSLYALDSDGRAWTYNEVSGVWKLLPPPSVNEPVVAAPEVSVNEKWNEHGTP